MELLFTYVLDYFWSLGYVSHRMLTRKQTGVTIFEATSLKRNGESKLNLISRAHISLTVLKLQHQLSIERSFERIKIPGDPLKTRKNVSTLEFQKRLMLEKKPKCCLSLSSFVNYEKQYSKKPIFLTLTCLENFLSLSEMKLVKSISRFYEIWADNVDDWQTRGWLQKSYASLVIVKTYFRVHIRNKILPHCLILKTWSVNDAFLSLNFLYNRNWHILERQSKQIRDKCF